MMREGRSNEVDIEIDVYKSGARWRKTLAGSRGDGHLSPYGRRDWH